MWTQALIFFVIAIVSDVLDGFIARICNEESVFGTYLDPCADKLLILSCYVLLHITTVHGFFIPFWFLMLIVAKEILLGIGAVYFSLIRKKIAIRPRFLGKFAMFVQSAFIALLLLHGIIDIPLYILHANMWFVVLCVFVAFIQYSVILLQRLVV